jgi:hypothetical protein
VGTVETSPLLILWLLIAVVFVGFQIAYWGWLAALTRGGRLQNPAASDFLGARERHAMASNGQQAKVLPPEFETVSSQG